MNIANPQIHENLIALGFTHTHHPEEWVDYGDAETGPMVDFSPPFEEYWKGFFVIVIDREGCFCVAEDCSFDDPMGEHMGMNE